MPGESEEITTIALGLSLSNIYITSAIIAGIDIRSGDAGKTRVHRRTSHLGRFQTHRNILITGRCRVVHWLVQTPLVSFAPTVRADVSSIIFLKNLVALSKCTSEAGWAGITKRDGNINLRFLSGIARFGWTFFTAILT